MIEKLSEKDKRTLKRGCSAIAIILLTFLVIFPWAEDWRSCRAALAVERAKLESITAGGEKLSAKQEGLFSIVPVFEMPKTEKDQEQLFRGKFNEQLKKAGIKIKSLQSIAATKSRQSGSRKMLKLQCQGKCNFNQAMDLLAALNENPYFVGVENLQLTCDAKNRNEINLLLTVSTFVK